VEWKSRDSIVNLHYNIILKKILLFSTTLGGLPTRRCDAWRDVYSSFNRTWPRLSQTPANSGAASSTLSQKHSRVNQHRTKARDLLPRVIEKVATSA